MKTFNGKKQESPTNRAERSEAEQDLLAHMSDGYKLETDLLGRDPVLRNLKNDEVIRSVGESQFDQGSPGARSDHSR